MNLHYNIMNNMRNSVEKQTTTCLKYEIKIRDREEIN